MGTAWALGVVLVAQTVSMADAAEAHTPAADVVVVCHDDFLPALKEWWQWREGEGRRLALVRAWNSTEDIRRAIREVARQGSLRWVVLVGDAPPVTTVNSDAPKPRHLIPTHYQQAQRIADFGPDATIASDNWYADTDDDGVPDVAVGRMSVESSEELRTLSAKIRAYEASAPGSWQRRIHLTAGAGGFGAVADSIIEWCTKKLLTERIPPHYTTTFTYASWQSPYCPDPRRFSSVTLDRLNEGCWFWVYMGHGHPMGLRWLEAPGRRYRTLDVSDLSQLSARQCWPVALLLACYTGAFDATEPCLAEGLARAPGGPVASVAATRTTMPYGMAMLGSAMMYECFSKQRPTLGELLLNAKRSIQQDTCPENDPLFSWRQLLDQLALTFVPGATKEKLRAERDEHVALFHLLGDPLLKLRYFKPLAIEVPAQATAGESIQVTVDALWAGQGTIELLTRRDRARVTFPPRRVFQEDDGLLGQFQREYEQVQNPVWIAVPQRFQAGRQKYHLTIPAEAAGPCVVRVVLQSHDDEACGAAELFVHHAPNQPPPTP